MQTGRPVFAPPVSPRGILLLSNLVLFQPQKKLIAKDSTFFNEEQKKFVKQWFDEHPDDSICHLLKNKKNELASSPSLQTDFRVLCDRTSTPPSYWVIYYGKKHGKELGEGGESVVKTCFNMETNEWFAVKVYHSKIKPIFSENEHRQLKSLGVFSVLIKTPQKSFLISPICEGKDLINSYEDLKKISDAARAEIASSLCDELRKIHEKNIIHRDLKPDNVVVNLETNTAKIIDFSFAVTEDDLKKKTELALLSCGTRQYLHLALQVEIQLKRPLLHSKASDIYNLILCIITIFDALMIDDNKKLHINSINCSPFAREHIIPFFEKESKKALFQMPTIAELIAKLTEIQCLLANSHHDAPKNSIPAAPTPMKR